MGTIINAKKDSELESVERSAKRITQKMLYAKTLAHSNISKTLFFCHFFINNFFAMFSADSRSAFNSAFFKTNLDFCIFLSY
jgi:hypothetical protein